MAGEATATSGPPLRNERTNQGDVLEVEVGGLPDLVEGLEEEATGAVAEAAAGEEVLEVGSEQLQA